jgi:hypothetical protein
MTSARLLALLCAQLLSASAWAQTVSFDLPSTDVVNRSNVAFLVFGGSCSNVGEQVSVTGPGTFSASAQCQDTGRWELANVSLTHLSDGLLTFTARHMDTAQASRTLKKDTLAPTLSLLQPSNGSSIDAVNQSALLVRGSCSDLNQPVTVRARPASANTPVIERQLPCPSSRSFSTTLDVSLVPDGDTQIFVQHRDAAGNTAQQDLILYKDTEPLLVSMAPIGDYIPARRSASLLVEGTCNKPGEALFLDVTGPSGYMVTLFTSCGADGTWGFANVSVTDAPDEELTFTATLTHSVTGGSASVQLTAIKDATPPILALLTPTHGARVTSTTGTALHLSGSCSESTPVSVAVGGVVAATGTPCQSGAFSLLYELGGLPDGDIAVRVLQTDVAGNTARQDLSIQKDVLPASVSVGQPASGSFVNVANAASFRFSGACSEHGSFAEPVLLSGAVSASALCVAGSWSVTLSLTTLPEGPLSVRVAHGDTAGNPPAEVLLELVKDVVPPLLGITSPAVALGEKAVVNATNVDTLEVLGSCSEDGRPLEVSGSLPGAATCMAGAFVFRPALQGAPDGDLLLHFTLTDAAGNSSTQSLGLFKDTQPPAVTLANAADPLVLNVQTAVALVLSGGCSEHGAFATPVSLVAPVGALAVCAEGTWQLTLSLSGLAEGSGVLRLEHRDAAGNLAVLERAYVKDTVPPVVSVTRPAAGDLVNAANQHSVTVKGACDEADRYVTLLTAAGLSSARCESGAFAAVLDLTGAPDGDVLIRARLEDAAGNAAVQDVIVFKDVAPPSLTLANASDPLPLNATTAVDTLLTGECSEHGSFAAPVQLVAPVPAAAACLAGTWALQVSFSELPDGHGTLELEHTDRAGNTVRLARAYVKDTVAPLLTLTEPGPGFHVSAANVASVRVAGTCNEEGRAVELSGPVAVSVPCTSGRYQTEVSLAGAPDGDVTLRARLTDAAGNATVQDARVHKDTVVPTLTLTSVGDPVVLNAGSSTGLWLMGGCSEHSTPVELVSPVAATAACDGVTWSLWVSLTALPDGSGTLKLKHRDAAGNAAWLTRTYRKDTVAPLLALTRPAPHEAVNASSQRAVPVAGTCSEEGQPVEVTAPVAASAPCTGGAFSLTLSLGAVPDGDVAIRTRLKDAAGNETWQDILVLKDTLLPALTLANAEDPLALPATPGASLTLSGTCSEHAGTASPVRLVLPVTATAACHAGAWSLQVSADAFPAGTGSVELAHADVAGNTARVVRATFKAPPAPSLAVTNLAPGAHVTSYTHVEGTCSEDARAVVLLAPTTSTTSCASGRFRLTAYLSSLPEGPVTLRLRHTNAYGGEVIVELPVTKDTVRPALTVTHPAGWDLGPAEALVLRGTCSEPGQPVLVRGAVTGQLPCAETKTFSGSLPLTAWGTLKVDVEHRDLAGNSVALSRTFERCVYPPRVAAPEVGPSGRFIEADFNADGVRDVLMGVPYGISESQPDAGGIKLYLGRAATAPGTGGFEDPSILTTSLQPDMLTAADFNADGALDILVYRKYVDGLSLMTGRLVGGRPSGTFNPPYVYAHLKSLGVLLATHVNDDNVIDLVMTSGYWNRGVADSLTVSLGRQACGPGVDFEPQFVIQPNVKRPEAALVSVADFNRDGRMDIVYSDSAGKPTVLLRTSASGTQGLYQPPQVLELPAGMSSSLQRLITVDLNGDSFMDIAAATLSPDSAVITYGRGDGTFLVPREYPVGASPATLVAADVNADGHQDLVSGAGTGGLTILPGGPASGPGGYDFGPAVGYPMASPMSGLSVRDVTGDAVPDFIIGELANQAQGLMVARPAIHARQTASLGQGPFHPPFAVSGSSLYSSALVAADFNADGILDLASSSSDGVRILRGQGVSGVGNGTFSVSFTSTHYSSNRALAAADLNEDGALDLVASGFGSVSVLLGNRTGGVADGTFAAPVTQPCISGEQTSVNYRLFVGDFNGDGVKDLMCDNEERWWENTGTNFHVLFGRGAGGVGDGTFDPQVIVLSGVKGLKSALADDFNRDGVSDLALVVEATSRREVHLLFGTGAPGAVFHPPVIHGDAVGAHSLSQGDFNADGVPDLLSWDGGTVTSILLGEAAEGIPTGAFTSSRSAKVESRPDYGWGYGSAVVDFDRDGALDLVLGGNKRLELSQRVTSAPGFRFHPRSIYALPAESRGVTTGDFNEDGVPDLAVGVGGVGVSIMLGRAPTAP